MRAAFIYYTTGKIVVQYTTQPATVYICFIFDKKRGCKITARKKRRIPEMGSSVGFCVYLLRVDYFL